MKYFLYTSLIGACLQMTAQVEREINYKFNPTTKTFELDGSRYPKHDLKKRSYCKKINYTLKLTDVNSGIHSSKASVKLLKKDIVIPDVLKSLVPMYQTPIVDADKEAQKVKGIANYSRIIFLYGAQFTEAKKFSDRIQKVLAIYEEFKLKVDKDAITLNETIDAGKTALDSIQSNTGWDKSTEKSLLNAFESDLESFATTIDNCNYLLKWITVDDVKEELLSKISELTKIRNKVAVNKNLVYDAFENIFDAKNAQPSLILKKFEMKGDFAKTSITLVRKKLETGKNDTIKFEDTFYRKNHFKIQFTTGFVYNNLVSKSYQFDFDTAGNRVGIVEEKNPKRDIAVGALVHLSFSVVSCFKVGISGGTSISLMDQKARHLLGGSLIFGRKKEFEFSGGVSFAKLPELTQNALLYRNDKDVLKNIGSSVPVYDKWQTGGFFAITYSIAKL